MATGKVKTLYSDKEKTEALFPRTKTSAISDANGVGLDVLMENILYSGTDNPEVAAAPLDADTLGGIPADDYATENFVAVKIAEAQMGGSGGDIDLSGYATKDDLNALDAADVGARPSNWMPTAEEVGAAPTNHDHNHIVVAGVNSDWRNAPNGISMWKYEGADTTALNLPTPHCFVHVMKESAARGIAIAYKWDFGVCTMWNNSLHDTWRGWTVVHGSGNTIVPIANGGTGATSLAGALQAMFPDSGTSKYIPMFGSNWEDRKFATPTELKTAMGINGYFNAYGASGTDELTALKNNWPAIAVGAFILFTILSSGYRTFVGVKVDNNYGAVIEIAYGSGSIYKYRLNGGTWYEHHHAAH